MCWDHIDVNVFVFFTETVSKVTDLRVQLYKKRQQQQRVESDQDSLENAEIFSSDEGEDEFQQSQKYSPGANRVVKKSPGRDGNKR